MLGEVRAILAATSGNSRDHLIYSFALGTGRLAELVGLNVGDVYAPDDLLSQHSLSPITTTVYMHPSDEEMYQRVRGLSC